MKAEKNKVVSLTYELIVDGALADKADENRPLDYIHGTGMLLPKFESEVEGKEPGEEFAFTLTPEEGYGTFDERMLVVLPKEAFMMDGKVRDDLLVVGKMIPMVNESGNVVNGMVHEVNDEKVTMNFNHPMAGKTLNFTGKVVAVRDATEKELQKGHPCKHHDKKDGDCCHHGDCHKNAE
ncbi:MAG: peptidylprolyl isomerase [Bacteroidales bacterium]|nr:peptidylprolyl isomerase [Bacteroidales bacterium]